ncbi:MAG: Ig-like domain-containing protein [Nanoarchaeota archaeon]
MVSKNVIVVLAVLLLVALSACSVPPRSGAAKSADCADQESLPDIDDIGIDEGIQNAAGALGDAEGKTTNKSAPAAQSPLIKKTVTEGDLVVFPNLNASDPDGDKITFTFEKPLDKSGKWQTKAGDAGEYPITITASDGKNTVTQKVLITVKAANRAPLITGPNAINAKEGENVVLNQEFNDPDGDKVAVTYGGWMTEPIKKTTFNDAGDHDVTVKASDGKLSSVKNVTVKVANTNRAPAIGTLTAISATEGDKVVIVPQASDPDGDKTSFIFSKPLDDRGVWQTKAGDAGAYTVNVTVSDGALTDSASVKITVAKLNQAPLISGLSDVTVDEGQTVTLSPKVSDPDGDKVTLVYSGWMTSATKATSYGDSGTYEVTLTASDTAGNSAKKTISVTVNDQNRPPQFNPDAFK